MKTNKEANGKRTKESFFGLYECARMFLKYEGTQTEEYWRFSIGNWVDLLGYEVR